MEKVTTENPHRFSRREVLRAGLTVAAAVGVSQLASSKSQGREKELVTPKVTSLPTIGHDVIFIPAPPQEPTPTTKENIVAEAKPVVAEANPLVVEEERNPQPAPKESSPEYNLLSPEAFAPYAAMGGSETGGEEILDYFPQSYNEAPDSLKGLWGRAVDAKLRDKPQANTVLTIELATLPEKISFDYLLVLEGTKFFDIQEQNERILPCDSNVIVLGKIDGEENFLAVYQEPVNSCYYFAKVSKDVLGEQKDLTASKNLVVEAFNPALQNLKEIGTEEERKRLYEVKEGDSLVTIAERFGLPSWHCLYARNPFVDPFSLASGQKLDIPNHFQETEYIKSFTPNDEEITLSPDSFTEKMVYFPETGHSVKEPFLSIFKSLGVEVTGYPISEATPGNASQYFENLIIEWRKNDYYDYIAGRPKADGINPKFFVYPLGWTLHFRNQHLDAKVNELPPAMDEYALDDKFADFYNQKGGLEILGYPVEPPFVFGGKHTLQFLTNCLLSYDHDQQKVKLSPIVGIFIKGLPAEQQKYPWFQPLSTEKTMGITEALSMVYREKQRILMIEARAVLLMAAHQTQDSGLLDQRGIAHDKLIFEELASGQELTFNNARAVLAWYEARFKMNPALNEALQELRRGGSIINNLLKNKVSPSLFNENKVPELPNDWQDVFVFAGGGNGLGGGRGDDHHPLLYGNYDEYRGDNPDDEQKIVAGLVGSGLHEAVHSLVQAETLLIRSPWKPEKEPADPNYVPPEVRRGHLAHMAMCSLTAPAQEAYGFEPEIEPRIAYIYQVLKNGGVADPYGLIVEAAATFNSDRLWKTYEAVRGENINLDLLIETIDLAANSKINFGQDLIDNLLAEFKQDYRRYLVS